MKLRKAIIPAAGWGTRLLPASKAIPKEMIPIIDKPGIQYIVEEVCSSGLEEMIVITSRGKESIEDHFDVNPELELVLEMKGMREVLEEVRKLSRMVSLVSLRQKVPLGTGDAIRCAVQLVAGEWIAVLYPDDVIDAEVPVTRQLIQCSERFRGGVVAVREVPQEDTHLYGIIEGERVAEGVYRITNIVEKPSPGKAPSRLAIIGRFILPPEIFPILERLPPSADGEVQLAAGLMDLSRCQPLYGYQFSGTRYDIGDKLGLVQATIGYAWKRPELRSRLKQWLGEFLQE